MKKTDQVCSEFFAKFPKHQKGIKNEDRVAFMLTNTTIRSKLDEWIDGSRQGILHGVSKKKSNVTNHIIEAGVDNESYSQSQESIIQQNGYEKDPAQSEIHRELGNTLFKQKKLYESLHSYNKAILLAPFSLKRDTSQNVVDIKNSNIFNSAHLELLSLSLANRSAVYYELGEDFYDKSLEDANLAFKYGYPERLKNKLLLRKANIYVKKKEWDLAQNIVEQFRVSYKVGRDEEVTNHLQPDVASRMNEVEKYIKEHKVERENRLSASEIINSSSQFVENDQFENASSSVAVQYLDESTTRFVTATAFLKKGDVLFQEYPFASVLIPQFYESHCHNCYLMLKKEYFFPCQKCTQVKFCSDLCSELAWDTYHKYECHSLDLLDSVGIAHLGVRVVLCAGIKAIREALQKHDFLQDPKNISIFAKGCSTYERVYSLLDHVEEMYLEDVFQYTLTASLLYKWLIDRTEFFADSSVEESLKVGGVILRHICQLICNAHAITDVLNDINIERVSLSTADESQLRIASAIFPSASMMNHSCSPNIAFGFVNGKNLIVKLIRDVEIGEEVFNCYGPHYRRMSVKIRKDALNSQYFFNCHCKPCTEESSLNMSFVEVFSSFKCDQCEGPVISPDPDVTYEQSSSKCQQCGSVVDIQMAACMYTDRLFQDGEVLLGRGKVDQALNIFQTCYNQRRQFLYKYHSDIGQLCDLIGRCHAILGEFSKAAEYVKKSLVYVEKRFGSESIEYGREVKKYVELLIQTDKDRYATDINKFTKIHKSILNFESM